MMIVEVPHSGVHWAEPVDISADEIIEGFEDGTIGMSSDHVNGISVGFADGSTHFISGSLSGEGVKALSTKAANDPFPTDS